MKVLIDKTCYCDSVLLYGSETWTLTKAQEKSLDGTYTKMLRMELGISWKDKVSNICFSLLG